MANEPSKKNQKFLLGNEAIARAALESGVNFAAGYPGTPSSEIIQTLANHAKEADIHVEWSTNEKVAAEGSAAAAFAGLRSIVGMKNAGLSVALDFLSHLSMTGLGQNQGSMVVIVCDDPDAHSSGDETDSRWLSRFSYAPLIEPSSIPEAKELMSWAMDLSEEFDCHFMLRSYTRLSHASNMVELKDIKKNGKQAQTDNTISISPYIARPKHALVLERLNRIKERFETCAYNKYFGPENPELVVVCGGSGFFCTQDAIELLNLDSKVGILKIVTQWPFPKDLVVKQLEKSDKILIAEEVDPFIENLVKEALADAGKSGKIMFGKESGHIPAYGEISPDRVTSALTSIFELEYEPRPESYVAELTSKANPLLLVRGLAWCAGCPHRATFWAIEKAIKKDGRNAYLTGDIGCYTLDVFPGGKKQINLLHAMGSGAGLASGLGQLAQFGYKQPVISICGDSTFFHSTIPALINAVYNGSHMLQIILDNQATAMTGFQPHPGTGSNAIGEPATPVPIEVLCRSLGCEVTISDPFDVKNSIRVIRDLLKHETGVQVLIMRKTCELLRNKIEKKYPFRVRIDTEKCRGEDCGICRQQFRCPALMLDNKTKKTSIREHLCCGCGACGEICPFNAIVVEENIG